MIGGTATKPLIAVGLAISLSACVPAEPSEVDLIRALPIVPAPQALSVFEEVCVKGLEPPTDGTFIFERDTQSSGAQTCTMRARAPAGSEVFSTLVQRFGRAREHRGGTIRFDGYPNGPLFYTTGFRNGDDEGTYLLGVVN